MVGLGALLVGLPALRIRGLFLAVTTLSFGVASTTWLFHQSWLVDTSNPTGTSLQISRPDIGGVNFQNERNYYWLRLAALVGVACLAWSGAAGAAAPLPVGNFTSGATTELTDPGGNPPGSDIWTCRPSAGHPHPVIRH